MPGLAQGGAGFKSQFGLVWDYKWAAPTNITGSAVEDILAFTVPEDELWEFLLYRFLLTTSATVANRFAGFRIAVPAALNTDGTVSLQEAFFMKENFIQTAGVFRTYYYETGMTNSFNPAAGGIPEVIFPGPLKLILPPESTLYNIVNHRQVGDVVSNQLILVRSYRGTTKVSLT